MTLSVQLTGDGAQGLSTTPRHRFLTESLPQTVKLGRTRPAARPQCLSLAKYVSELRDIPIPAAVDWYTKAAEPLARMYLNDRWGDCVFAGKAHLLGVWSANDPDSGGTVLATDREIQDQYFAYTGGRDSGANISEVLNLMKSPGFLAGGKRYTIDGYVSCDWRSKELTQIGLALFGGGSIGINLPSAWTSAAVWDVTNSQIVGGHDVTPCGYGARVLGTNADGVVISSWGRLYLITWAAWTSSRWLDELYFALPSFLWTGADKQAPSGVDFATLKADLALLSGGNLPPLPGPTPPTPPTPPAPPVPPPPVPQGYRFVGDPVHVGMFGGTITPTGRIVAADAAAIAGLSLDYLSLGEDAAKLVIAAWMRDRQAVHDAVDAIFADLGMPLADSHRETLAAASLDWRKLLRDAGALVAAVVTRNPAAIVAAALVIATDLGLTLAPAAG